MSKENILEYFKDINHAYNDCTKYDTLKRMLDELQDPLTDATKYFNTIYELSQTLGVSYDFIDEKIKETVMALKALPHEPCEDAISRKDALFAVRVGMLSTATVYGRSEEGMSARREIEQALQQLPPVKPEQKMGRWVVTDDDLVYCSECEDSYYSRPIDASWYYCPNCGARMDGEE